MDEPARRANGRAAAPTPRPVRAPGALGRLHVVQLLWWQALGALVVGAVTAGAFVELATVVAGLLLLPSVVRVRGRWLYRWLLIWLRYRARGHALRPRRGDQRSAFLEHVEPSAVTDVLDVDGETAGAMAHAGGILAVLELCPADAAAFAGAPTRLPSLPTLLPPEDPAAPPVSLQLLVQVAPAPSPLATGPVAVSYRELVGTAVPISHRAWLVVQVHRTADAYTEPELRPFLVSGLRRLRRRLRQEGTPNRLLDGDDLLTVTTELAGLPVRGTHGTQHGTHGTQHGTALAREGWRHWSAAGLVQSCHRLVRWPQPGWRVDSVLSGLPATTVTLSMAVARAPVGAGRDDDVVMELAIRLAAPDARQLAAADAAFAKHIRDAGGRSERLDGEQRWGLAATLPLGGFRS